MFRVFGHVQLERLFAEFRLPDSRSALDSVDFRGRGNRAQGFITVEEFYHLLKRVNPAEEPASVTQQRITRTGEESILPPLGLARFDPITASLHQIGQERFDQLMSSFGIPYGSDSMTGKEFDSAKVFGFLGGFRHNRVMRDIGQTPHHILQHIQRAILIQAAPDEQQRAALQHEPEQLGQISGTVNLGRIGVPVVFFIIAQCEHPICAVLHIAVNLQQKPAVLVEGLDHHSSLGTPDYVFKLAPRVVEHLFQDMIEVGGDDRTRCQSRQMRNRARKLHIVELVVSESAVNRVVKDPFPQRGQ